MTVGADELLAKYGSRLKVAEAFILGKIKDRNEACVSEIVSMVTLEAARIRLQASGILDDFKAV